jgi:hypothetical protein
MDMKLIGELKKKVERAKDVKEAKEVIEGAGMELTEEELEKVAGGLRPFDGWDHENYPSGTVEYIPGTWENKIC